MSRIIRRGPSGVSSCCGRSDNLRWRGRRVPSPATERRPRRRFRSPSSSTNRCQPTARGSTSATSRNSPAAAEPAPGSGMCRVACGTDHAEARFEEVDVRRCRETLEESPGRDGAHERADPEHDEVDRGDEGRSERNDVEDHVRRCDRHCSRPADAGLCGGRSNDVRRRGEASALSPAPSRAAAVGPRPTTDISLGCPRERPEARLCEVRAHRGASTRAPAPDTPRRAGGPRTPCEAARGTPARPGA